MRVAVLLDAVLFAGAERALEVLLQGMTAAGDEVAIVLPEQADPQVAGRLAPFGPVVAVPGLARRPSPAAALAVRRAVRASRPDVVHLNLTDQGDGLVLVAAVRGLGVPVVAVLHNAIPGTAAWRERLSGLVLRQADRVVAVSEAVGRHARAAGARTSVVHNGLDPVPLDPDPRARLGLPPDALVVGGVGRLREQKGWEVLAEAGRLLRGTHPQARVVVVGDGPLHGPLARAGGLELLGPRDDAAALVGAFDVLAVPSRFEAFGLVAVEAMHAGVPVVASDVDGLPEVLGDTGVLVPPEDAGALHAALAALLDDPERRARLGAAGRARALSLFSPGAMVAGVRAVHAEVADGG